MVWGTSAGQESGVRVGTFEWCSMECPHRGSQGGVDAGERSRASA